jgi:hypothetical protein
MAAHNMGTTQKNIKDEDKKVPVYQQTKLNFGISPQDASLSTQAQWYIYLNQYMSKATFENSYFKNMICAGGRDTSWPNSSIAIQAQTICAEFKIFILFLKVMIELKI